MARMLGNNEVAFESARSQFWVVDANVSLSQSSFSPLGWDVMIFFFFFIVLCRNWFVFCTVLIKIIVHGCLSVNIGLDN